MKEYTGKVTLVGAGPGDGELLTLRAARVLAEADVVLFDRLVGADILARIPPDAEIIDVGKRSGHHPIPQNDINRILVDKARENKRVVRLKGGDSYLFGRGAEELNGVAAAGIPFEVVPGVSASLAVPACAGIPVTHRDFSSSVHILTGHAKDGHAPNLDYDTLARLGGTLVFMMGFTALEGILRGLRSAGMPDDIPAALIQDGTLPTQRKLVATVATLWDAVQAANMGPPSVLVVGRVCSLSDGLDWFSCRPLFGKTVLVTRPQTADSVLADRLQTLGCGVIRFPCIHLTPANEPDLNSLAAYRWLVFTSAYGVEVFFDALTRHRRDIRTLAGLRFAAIGGATAAAIECRGILVDYTPDVFDAAHLARGLAPQIAAGERALLFRARAGTPELPEILAEHGVAFDDFPAYDTALRNPAAPRVAEQLADGGIDFVTFTSASTVDGFVAAVGEETARTAPFVGVCIGAQTAAKAAHWGIRTVISPEATMDSMVDTIQNYTEEVPR